MSEAAALQSELVSVLRAIGLESLAPWIIEQQIAGKDNLSILTELRQRPEYAARFPAMAELQKQATSLGLKGIDEGWYIEMENAYRQAFETSGLPPQMFDTPDDFKRLIEARVSPTEVQRRVAAAKEAVMSTDPNVRQQLLDMYGITTTDLTAYALDPSKTSDYMQRVATTAILSGYGRTAGLGVGMTDAAWEGYAQDLVNQQATDEDIRGLIAEANVLATEQRRLAEIEGDDFTTADALDVAVRSDSNKVMASQKRVAREKARFSGSQGISTGSLTRGSI